MSQVKNQKPNKSSLKKEDLPKSLILLGQEFHIELSELEKAEDEDTVYGETNGQERKIRIDKYHPKPSLNHTLFHESIHAVLHISGQSIHLTEAQEEAITVVIENAFGDYINIRDLAGE
jgi:hypothetical protein